jgi:hypothetical protein
MALRPPQSLAARSDAIGALEAELFAERAAALGRMGANVEAALARLRAFDAGENLGEPRAALVKDAARAVWSFLVQREACGLSDQRLVIRQYAIPAEVLNRLGAG